jgi:hypothetical protein
MINDINFIPMERLRRRGARSRRLRQWLLCACCAAGVGAWMQLAPDHLADLRAYAHAVELQAQASKQQVSEVAKQTALKAKLIQQVALQQELVKPVNVAHVLAALATLTPTEVAFTELSLVSRRPEPADGKQEAASSRASGSRGSAPSRSPVDRDAIRLELAGIAPDDAFVATVVERLTDHKLFESVKLTFTRAGEVDNLHVREFRIELVVRLDREYLPNPQPAPAAGPQEARHAS